MICRICLRSTIELNEDQTCQRCSATLEKQRITVILQRTAFKRGVPYLPDTTIMTRSQWLDFRRWIDAFMSSVSDDEIDAYNVVARSKLNGKRQIQELRKRTDDGSGFVYLIGTSIPEMYKIGKAKDVKVRIGQHMRDYPVAMWFEHYIWCTNRHKAERYLLNLFADKQTQGEWFRLPSDSVQWLKELTTASLSRLVSANSTTTP